MTKLSELKYSMKIKPYDEDGLMLGEVWHNQRIDMLFDGIKSNKFNIELIEWVKDLMTQKHHNEPFISSYNNKLVTPKDRYGQITVHLSERFTIGQIKKLNAIMKAKSRECFQKRIYALSYLFTGSMSQAIFNKSRNESWMDFCNKHSIDSGLKKVDRNKEYEKTLNRLLEVM